MTRRPHQRSIWAGSDRQSRAFHKARLYRAVRRLVDFVRGIDHVGPGLGRYAPSGRLAALEAADQASLYIDAEEDEAA